MFSILHNYEMSKIYRNIVKIFTMNIALRYIHSLPKYACTL